MSAHRGLGLYRSLLHLYPRSFRDDYGADMVLLLADQLDDEPAWRVCGRSVADLAISVPMRHQEVHMQHRSGSLVPLVFGALSLAAAGIAVAAGSNVGFAISALLVAVASGVLAVSAARQTRPVGGPSTASAQWWKLLALGAAALLIVVFLGELTDLELWMPMLVTIAFGWVMIAAGAVLGVVHLLTRSRPTTT